MSRVRPVRFFVLQVLRYYEGEWLSKAKISAIAGVHKEPGSRNRMSLVIRCLRDDGHRIQSRSGPKGAYRYMGGPKE